MIWLLKHTATMNEPDMVSQAPCPKTPANQGGFKAISYVISVVSDVES